MSRLFRIILCLVGLAFGLGRPLPAPAAGPVSLDADAPVSLDAGSLSYDKASDTFRASGDVRLQKGDIELRSANITWNRDTGEAKAEGGVHLTSPEGIMEGDALTYNLETGSGRLLNGRVFAPGQNFHIAGREIHKFGERHFQVLDGTFTTCEGDHPAWKFGAGTFDVTMGGYARAKNVLFYLKDVPVFYVPILIYPAKTERESGLLLPRYGFSSRRGTQLNLAWYQVLARNQDATLELDYLSRFGVGKGLEYRYIFGDDKEGWFHAYHVTESGRTDRYSLVGQHRGPLPGALRLTADVDFVSSRDYYADFGENYEVYTRDKAVTVISLARNWHKLNLSGQGRYVKDLEQPSEATLQRLPETRMAWIRQRLDGLPLFVQFDAAGDYFWRRKGEKGLRLTARPALSTDLFSNAWFEFVPEIGYRERLYQTTDGYAHEGIFDVEARTSTLLARVYPVRGKVVRKIRHTIEPELTYQYIPKIDQSGLPNFDSLDRIGPEDRILYSLTNRFTARLEPENGERYYHEFLYLRLSQSYDLQESRRTLELSRDQRKPFSPLLLEAIVRPNRNSYVDMDVSYDINSGENRLVDFNLRGALTDSAGNDLSIDYRNRRGELEYLAGNLTTSLLKPVYLNYLYRYDLAAGTALENAVGLEYRARCWSVFVNYRQRPDDQEILLSFSLSGLGRVAGLGRSRPRSD